MSFLMSSFSRLRRFRFCLVPSVFVRCQSQDTLPSAFLFPFVGRTLLPDCAEFFLGLAIHSDRALVYFFPLRLIEGLSHHCILGRVGFIFVLSLRAWSESPLISRACLSLPVFTSESDFFLELPFCGEPFLPFFFPPC